MESVIAGLDASYPRWSPNGTTISFLADLIPDATILFELHTMTTSGGNITTLTSGGAGAHAWSPNGSEIVYYSTPHSGLRVITSGGTFVRQLTTTAWDGSPSWSPDGSQIAFSRSGDVYTIDSTGGTPTNITNSTAFDREPHWGNESLICPGGSGFMLLSCPTPTPTHTPTPTATPTPTPTPILGCPSGLAQLIPEYLFQPQGFTQEAIDMQAVGNANGLYLHEGPTLNSRKIGPIVPWYSQIVVDARLDFGSAPNRQIWYRASYMSSTGWIVAHINGKGYVSGSDPCESIAPPSQITFPYDRQAAGNYAIEHSWQNNSLTNPIAGFRVTRRLTDNQSGYFIPFADFTYSNLTGGTGATGSAIFISEVIWAGGLPMTLASTNSCDPNATNNAGWCWTSTTTNGNPSNPWDKHEQIIAYYTDSLAPSTVSGYNVTNTVLGAESKGTQLSFINTLNSDHISGNRAGQDNFNNPDEPGTTDFNESIPILRQGEVDDLGDLESLVSTNFTGIRAGDYILTDPVNTGGGAHGLIVVGWGPIEDCEVSLTTRRTINNFTSNRISANTVPFVADFTTAQSPTPRPFYCSMYHDQLTPVTGYFNRHDWYFYTIEDTITINISSLYVDTDWAWDASAGQ